MPKLNLKGVGRQEPVEEGVYALRASGQKHNKVATGDYRGVDRCNLELTIIEGEHEGRKVYKSYILDPDLLWIFKADMLILEASEEMMESEDADSVEIVKSIIGKECSGEISVNDWTDKDGNEHQNNRVDRLHEPGFS